MNLVRRVIFGGLLFFAYEEAFTPYLRNNMHLKVFVLGFVLSLTHRIIDAENEVTSQLPDTSQTKVKIICGQNNANDVNGELLKSILGLL